MTEAHYYRIGNSSVWPTTEGFSTRRCRKLAVPRSRFATRRACSTPTERRRREFNGRKCEGGLITIANFTFSLMALQIAPGATIKVTNKDCVTYVLSTTHGRINTGSIEDDGSKMITAPIKPGKFPFTCDIHRLTTATRIVKCGISPAPRPDVVPRVESDDPDVSNPRAKVGTPAATKPRANAKSVRTSHSA